MDDKVKDILNLISEKSRGLCDELNDLSHADSDVDIELRGQICILDELYNEVLLISKQTD